MLARAAPAKAPTGPVEGGSATPAEWATNSDKAQPKRRSVRDMLSRGSVEWSLDFERIKALPRRSKPDLDALVQHYTTLLRRPGGTMLLWPIQAWVLHEASQVQGVIGSIAVGEGKSLADCLLPMVVPNCKRAVLFIPPSLRAQFLGHDWEFYGQHFTLPNLAGGSKFVPGRPVVHVLAYSELSSPKASVLLEQINPDLIIADECHQFKARSAARTIRFIRFFMKHTETRFAGWSGTLTSRSLNDYAHLSALALGAGSPLPIEASTVEEWASALDPTGCLFEAGVLRDFCEKGEKPRSGFRRRFIDTPGVVATDESKLGVSLTFHERKPPPMPAVLVEHLRRLRRPPTAGGWIRPDKEELVDALRVMACARELACGFFYFWKFPHGEPKELIDLWFERRQSWNRELRAKLLDARPHLDSPHLCQEAARRYYAGGCAGCGRGALEDHQIGCTKADEKPLWASQTWLPWEEIQNQVYHEQAVEWIDDFLIKDAAEWAKEPGIVWTEHDAVGRKIARVAGVPYYGGGDEASARILEEKGDRAIVASVKAQGEGKNLQVAFGRNLFVSISSDAKLIEQVIGRTHRQGQPRDEVEVWVYRHTIELAEALVKAKEKATYIQETMGTKQKLCYGAWGFTP